MKEKVKAYPDKNGVSVRGLEWSLWIRKVETKADKRTMFVVKPLKSVYNNVDQQFSYEELCKPIWLTPTELGNFMKALSEL